MKALVTGATGLVGFHLVNSLVENNYEVVALARNKEKLGELASDKVTTLSFDLTSTYDQYQLLDEFGDYIWFHVAAAISGATEDVLEEVNIKGTKKLVKKAEELSVDHFILVSSRSIYGVSHDEILTEDHKHLPDSKYGTSKWIQEEILRDSNLNYTIFRPPYIGGPNDENFLVEFAKRIQNSNMPSFSKRGRIGYIDARDLAQAMVLSAKNGVRNEVFNIQGEAIWIDEFVEKLADRLNVDPPYGSHYPYWLAMTAGFFGELKAKLKGSSAERSVSRYRIKTLTGENSMDTTKLTKIMGFEPKYSIDQSLDDFISSKEDL